MNSHIIDQAEIWERADGYFEIDDELSDIP
ncbi:hypothetical protein SAMN05192561_1103 [Halopenitus malekzadehii]|uniref:Uncharacterized protein n=1 Tax=Halopenitus malekzadehii TaxID=1267564 RepID=A0A1H6JIV2_9EURY|nr:hypothetical protein SAMN05192561_1103 [Halopenitus malekzadehii]